MDSCITTSTNETYTASSSSGFVPRPINDPGRNLPIRPPPLGPGRALNPELVFTPRPVGEAERLEIHNRLSALLAIGGEAKIRQLIKALKTAGFPEEIQKEIEKWLSDFEQIDAAKTEDRSLALAILIIKVLRPAFLYASREEQNQLLGLQDAAVEILRQIVPGESVEHFLRDCEEGIREERSLRLRFQRVQEVSRGIIDALSEVSQEVDYQIEQALERLRSRLTSLQDDRETTEETLETRIEQLQELVDQVREQLIQLGVASEELGRQDQENARAYQSTLSECEDVLEEVL